MICDRSETYFPLKYMKDVLPQEIFSFSPNGPCFTRIALNSQWSPFMLMSISDNDCFYPKEEEMEKQVYMLKAIVKISMLDREKKGS